MCLDVQIRCWISNTHTSWKMIRRKMFHISLREVTVYTRTQSPKGQDPGTLTFQSECLKNCFFLQRQRILTLMMMHSKTKTIIVIRCIHRAIFISITIEYWYSIFVGNVLIMVWSWNEKCFSQQQVKFPAGWILSNSTWLKRTILQFSIPASNNCYL
jgi:hypothetical protein